MTLDSKGNPVADVFAIKDAHNKATQAFEKGDTKALRAAQAELTKAFGHDKDGGKQ